jgi:hypothetical protein
MDTSGSDRRAAVVGRYVSSLLSGRHKVQSFRDEVLNKRLIRPDKFDSWRKRHKYDSLGQELTGIAQEIVKSYPGFYEEEVAKFILTGEPAPMRAVKAETQLDSWPLGASRITLIIDPRCSVKEVAAIYQEQKDILFAEKHYTGPKKDKPVEKKAIALAEFAVAHPYDKHTMKWDELIDAWDKKWGEEHPDWKYGEKKFAQTSFPTDVRRAVRGVIGVELEDLLTPVGMGDELDT